MANNLGINNQVLPSPFQSSTVPQVVNSTTKITQNDSNYFHGYRSNFDINQQKQQYQQRLEQQNSQNTKFNRNGPQRNQRTDRNVTPHQPNNSSYLSNWCELCERGIKQPYQLEKHLGEHEKCWFDNCTFEGHSTLLKKHIETRHQSGLFQRIGKIETDEDIEKWREELRKRYPTKANIEARRQAQEEQLKRGERIDEPNHRFGHTRNRSRAQHRSFTQDESNSSQMGKKKNDRKRRLTRNKNKFQKEEKASNIEKNEVVEIPKTEILSDPTIETSVTNEKISGEKKEIVPSSNALAAIMGMYGSDSESECDNDDVPMTGSIVNSVDTNTDTEFVAQKEDNFDESESNKFNSDEVPVDTNALKRPSDSNDDLPSKLSKVELELNENIEKEIENESDDEAPDDQPIQRQTNDSDQPKEEESGPTQTKPQNRMAANSKLSSKDRMPKRRTVLDMTRKVRNQNTLLEKLLQKDIRHERNVLLQCVRYVVENNFFGVGQSVDESKSDVKPEK